MVNFGAYLIVTGSEIVRTIISLNKIVAALYDILG
jgi:hypothetical protein